MTWRSKKQKVVALSSEEAEYRGLAKGVCEPLHVEVDRHFIKEKLDENIIQFPFVKSEDQLADILTKAVASQVFYNFLVKLGMNDIYAPT